MEVGLVSSPAHKELGTIQSNFVNSTDLDSLISRVRNALLNMGQGIVKDVRGIVRSSLAFEVCLRVALTTMGL